MAMNIDRVSFPASLLSPEKQFPLAKSKEFLKLIATIEGIYSLAEESLNAFKKFDLISFDPLGADCACHIRALYIARLVKRFLFKAKLSNELECALKEIKAKRQRAQELYETYK